MRFQAILATGLLLLVSQPAFGFEETEDNDAIDQANEVDFPAEMEDGRVSITGSRTSGDTDSFRVTNLVPGVEYQVTNDITALGIGIFDNDGTELDSVAFVHEQILIGIADASGELIVRLCGVANQMTLDCSTNDPLEVDDYLLTVPEPGPGLLAMTALLALAALARLDPRRALRQAGAP